MLPSNVSSRRHVTTHRQYFRRLIRPKQMDFEFALWLMLQLCFAPKKAYLHISYYKETKNQWSRDDPAYLVLLSSFLICSTIIYCLTFAHGVGQSIGIVLYVLFVDFLFLSVFISTLFWICMNRFLRSGVTSQSVEWLYAFDVQCNSYFLLFLCLHLVQYVFSPLLRSRHFVGTVLSNLLYVFAFSYYHYLNFLGFSSLPFLDGTEVLLYPIGILILILPFSIIARFNPTRFVLALYFGH